MTGAMRYQSDCDNCNSQTMRSLKEKRENRCVSRVSDNKEKLYRETSGMTFISYYRGKFEGEAKLKSSFATWFSAGASNRDESSSFRRCNDC